MEIKFRQRVNLATNIWQYFFDAERSVDFLPGQYVDLHLTGVKNDPRGPSRTFSFTNLPSDNTVSFVLKHFETQSPYKARLQALKPGEPVKIDNAMGDLVLPLATDWPLVFVAGGIGIASFASMFKQLLASKEERSIFFFYQLRDRRERIFQDLTSSYPLELEQIGVAPNQLSAMQIKESTPPQALIYLSGSQKFVENLQTDLEKSGTLRQQILFDYYDGYAEL